MYCPLTTWFATSNFSDRYIGDSEGKIPGILRESRSGYTVSVGDSVGRANRILEMSRDVETMNMGVRARRTFDQQFDQRHAFAAWEELFQQASTSS